MTCSRRPFHLPVMWRLCLLTLFLALALQPVFSVPVQPSLSIEEEYMERNITEEDMKTNHKWLKKNMKNILQAVGTSLSSVPGAGGVLSAMPQFIAAQIPEADRIDGIKSEMNALNARFDYFNEQLKWTQNHYQIAIDNIENSWLKYPDMIEKNEYTDRLQQIFFPFYTPLLDSALVIHRLLMSDPVTNTVSSTNQSLADVLAKQLRCHEKDVEAQFIHLMILLRRGNTMDEKYYKHKVKDATFREDKSKKIESESASAMFRAQQRCVSNSKLYIKRDIIERIDDTKNHQQIANNIGDFLRRTYDRYDWVVVAFTSHFSRNLFDVLKRHVFSGFTEIDRGTVTVAVASQIKGKYTKAKEVKQKIETCLQGVSCCEIETKILECEDVSDAYSAIHIFKNHAQTYISSTTGENENETYSESFASVDETQEQIYLGKCLNSVAPKTIFGKIISGFTRRCNELMNKLSKTKKDLLKNKFLILIKSDEEMDGKHDPCKNFKCENKGKCVLAPRTQIPMCECQYPLYGRRCENKIV